MKAKLKVKLKVFPKAWNKWPTLCVRMVCTKKTSREFFLERKKGSVITPDLTEAATTQGTEHQYRIPNIQSGIFAPYPVSIPSKAR